MSNRFILSAQLNLSGLGNTKPILSKLQKQLNSLKANINLNITSKTATNLNNLNKNLAITKQLLVDCAKAGQTFNSSLGGVNQKVNAAAKITNNAAKAAQQLNNQVQQTNNATKQAANSMFLFGKNAAQAIKKFGAFTTVTSAIISVGIAVKSAVKEALEFQHGLVRLSQISGLSTKNLSGLEKEISRLSTTLGVSSTELLAVSDVLAQAGLTIEETKTALEGLAKTKLAPTFGDLENTVEAAIASMRQFNIPVEDLKATLGSFNAVAAAFAVEADDISVAVRRAGAAFEASGGSLDEFIALFTSVRQTTREGAETIATGFRTIFTRLQRPQTLAFLKSLGVELTDLQGQFVGPYEAVKRLNVALNGIASTDPRFAQIVEELGGFRQVSKVIPLLQQVAVAERALGVARRGRESIDRDAITAQESVLVQLTKLREKFYELFRVIGNNDSVRSFVGLMIKVADSTIKVADSLSNLVPLFATLGALKLGSGLTNLAQGFSAGIKQPRKFARGGLVPGQGNRDTVPAMLMPGEYVLPKSAVQSVGLSNVQKFADGGIVQALSNKRFGMASLFPISSDYGHIEKRSVSLTGVPVAVRQKFGVNGQDYKYDLFTGSTQNNFAEAKFEKPLEKDIDALAQKYAQTIFNSIGAKGSVNSIDPHKFNFEQISGNIFEAAISAAGVPYGTKEGSADPFDFFSGVGPDIASQFFGNPNLAAIPTDAKRTGGPESKRSIDKKVGNLIQSVIQQTPLSKVTQARLNVAKATKKLAKGGGINGPDTVPALLTPGEYVLDKSTAQSVGYGNLDKIRKFNKGGYVQKFSGGSPGGVQSSGVGFSAISGLVYVLPVLLNSLDKMDSEIGKIVTEFSTLAITAGILGKQFVNVESVTKDIAGSKGLIGKGTALLKNKSALTGIGAGVGILASGIGGFLQRGQSDRINKGELPGSLETRGASALSFAGTGATLGATLGGPLAPYTAALGGLLGGLYGFFKDGSDRIEEAKNKIESIKFIENTEALTKNVRGLTSGKGSTGNLLAQVRGLGGNQKLTDSDIQVVQDLTTHIISTSKSLDDFAKFENGAGQALLDLSNKIGLDINQISQEIELRQKAADIQSKFNAAQLAAFNITKEIESFGSSITKASISIDDMSNTVNASLNNFKDINFTKDLAAIISQGLKGNAGQVGGALNQLGVNNKVSTQLTDSIKFVDKIPNILLGIVNDIGKQGPQIDIQEELKKRLEGAPQILVDGIISSLDVGAQDFNQKFTEEVTKNAQKYSEDLTKSTNDYLISLAEVAKQAQESAKKIISLIHQRTELEQSIAEKSVQFAQQSFNLNKKRGITTTSEFRAAGETTSTDLLTFRQQKLEARTSLKGQPNPQSLFERARNVQAQLSSVNTRLNNATPLSKEQKELADTAQKLDNEYRGLMSTMEELSTDTSRLTALQQELSQAEEARLKKVGFANDLAFGGREGRNDFARSAASAAVIAQNPSAIGSQAQEQAAQSFLDKLIDIGAGGKGLSVLGGKSAQQVKDDRLRAFLTQSGLDPNDVEEIVTVSKDEKRIMASILAEEELMRKSTESLLQLQKNKLSDLDTHIVNGFKDVVEELRNNQSTIQSVINNNANTFTTSSVNELNNNRTDITPPINPSIGNTISNNNRGVIAAAAEVRNATLTTATSASKVSNPNQTRTFEGQPLDATTQQRPLTLAEAQGGVQPGRTTGNNQPTYVLPDDNPGRFGSNRSSSVDLLTLNAQARQTTGKARTENYDPNASYNFRGEFAGGRRTGFYNELPDEEKTAGGMPALRAKIEKQNQRFYNTKNQYLYGDVGPDSDLTPEQQQIIKSNRIIKNNKPINYEELRRGANAPFVPNNELMENVKNARKTPFRIPDLSKTSFNIPEETVGNLQTVLSDGANKLGQSLSSLSLIPSSINLEGNIKPIQVVVQGLEGASKEFFEMLAGNAVKNELKKLGNIIPGLGTLMGPENKQPEPKPKE